MFNNSKKILLSLFVTLICLLALTTYFKSSAQDDYRLPVDTSYIDNLDIKIKHSAFGESRIYNSKEFDGLADIDSYIDVRKQALIQLANAIPDQEIEVAISPEGKLSLSDFKSLGNNFDFQIEELSLDLFVSDKWDRMVWVKKDSERVNIYEDAKSIMDKISEIESLPDENQRIGENKLDQPFNDEQKAKGFSDFTVRFARVKIKATQALRLNDSANILLVDPVTDIAAHFRGRVIDMPQLYVVKELKFGTIYRPENVTNFSDN